jgi:filamentous hemagglutinin family protein
MASTPYRLILSLTAFSLSIIVDIQPTEAQSLIVAPDGTRTIITPNGNRLDISGGTVSGGTNLFHSFQKFDLNSQETANFISNPQIQNIFGRVVGGNASIINGLIQVTGGNSNLYLMNPAGIIFGQNASLNIPASFTATTANGIGFAGGWFNAVGINKYQALIGNPNRFAFSMSQPGSIINSGNLAVGEGQSLTLIGGNVLNINSLTAPGGNITLAAVPGENIVRLSQKGMVLNLEIEPVTMMLNSQLPNSLKVVPTDLPKLITGGTVNEATNAIVSQNGTVFLTSSGISLPSSGGVTIASGILNVFGQNGGSINILGQIVEIFNAKINASGINNAGTVLIGGDYQGQGILPRAYSTFVNNNSTINADAVTGHGGKVIIWSDHSTSFSGNVTARGNFDSGKGGFIEVSGENLNYDGNVDLRASDGNWGTLLLDPASLIISETAVPDNYNITNPTPIPQVQQLATSRLVAALNNANVNLEATNNITVNTPLDASANAAGNNAGNLRFVTPIVNLNAPIILQAGRTISGTPATVNVSNTGRIQNAVDVAATGATLNLSEGIFSNTNTININKSLSLIGTNQTSTVINGNNNFRVFNIAAGDVTFTNLTIQNGNAGIGNGGGINYIGNGTLNVINSTIANNIAEQGGGISISSGTLNITNSIIANNSSNLNGGGINNNATTTINNSLITGNQVSANGLAGGGIFNYEGTLTLNNTTVNRNISASDGGGGITSDFGIVTLNNSTVSDNSAANTTRFGGGGILSFFDTNMTLNNSTISGNSIETTGGGIFVTGSNASLNNVTIANNRASGGGGGIAQINGTVNIKNTIIASNNNPTSPDVFGSFNDLGFNLIGARDGSIGFNVSTLVGTRANPINPRLGSLQDNGGSTPTQALLVNSPAINAGAVSSITTDQRGVSRSGIRDTIPDIGAYEAIRVAFNSPTYSVDNSNVATITVQADRALATGNGGNITVNYSTRDNTAISGIDYSTVSGTLTLTNADPSQSFNIPILTTATSNRTVDLNLTAPSNAVFGQVNSATLTIFNPPTPPVIPTSTPTPPVIPTPSQFSFACPFGLKPLEVREDLSKPGRKFVVQRDGNNCQPSPEQTLDLELPASRIILKN